MDADQLLLEHLDWHRIQQLKYRYCYCIDEKRCDEFVDLFTNDARIEYATREPYHGRDEIRAFIETHVMEADRMAHTALNPILDIDGDEASGQWYGIVFISNDADGDVSFGHGKYHETYRREEDGWKFASLRTESRFSTDI